MLFLIYHRSGTSPTHIRFSNGWKNLDGFWHQIPMLAGCLGSCMPPFLLLLVGLPHYLPPIFPLLPLLFSLLSFALSFSTRLLEVPLHFTSLPHVSAIPSPSFFPMLFLFPLHSLSFPLSIQWRRG